MRSDDIWPQGSPVPMTPASSPGHTHFVPMSISEPMTMTELAVWMHAGSMYLYAARAVTDEAVPLVVVAYEAPYRYARPRTQKDTEMVKVERFRVDCRARGTGDPFQNIGYNPRGTNVNPDFVGNLAGTGEEVGIECTDLAIQERRRALGLMEPLRAAVRLRGARAFQALRGMNVYACFREGDYGTGLPFKRSEAEAVAELVGLLADHRPNPKAIEHDANTPFPEQAPDIGLEKTSTGATIHAAPLDPQHEPNAFMAAVGFELNLAYTTTHTQPDVRNQLADVVKRKDVPGNDWLLISAGAPDNAGNIHPAEETIASLIIDGQIPLECGHLTRVALHRWRTGDAWEIYPTLRQLARPADDPVTSGVPALVRPSGLVVDRNAMCPCLSGRKFKVCHGRGPA